MSLHPDLAKLLARIGDALWENTPYQILSQDNITAFALAVAQAERERCAVWLDSFHPKWAAGTVRAMPDPDWETPDPETQQQKMGSQDDD